MTNQSLVELLREAAHSIACQVDPEDELVRQLRSAADELEKEYELAPSPSNSYVRPDSPSWPGPAMKPKNRQKKIEHVLLELPAEEMMKPWHKKHLSKQGIIICFSDAQQSINELIDAHNQRLEETSEKAKKLSPEDFIDFDDAGSYGVDGINEVKGY